MERMDQEQGRTAEQPHGYSCSSAIRGLKSALPKFDLEGFSKNPRFWIPSFFKRSLSSGLLVSSPPAPTTVYQVWPGKNVFFLDGRLICGPDPRGLILTAISFLLLERIFLTDAIDPSWKHPILIDAFSRALAATAIGTLLLTATRDPGIIPRNQASPSSSEVGTTRTVRRTRSRRIVIDGVETKQKFCRICSMFRAPRSSHCAVCDNCVDKFDHHCPWIGQCVGMRNYRFYLLSISMGMAFNTYMFAFSAGRIRGMLDATSAGIFSLLGDSPKLFLLAVASLMASCLLAGLLAFHAFLAAKNQTSNEMYKGRYKNSRNPYDRGVLKNIKECLLDELPPPRVDFRAIVDPNMLGSAARQSLCSPQYDVVTGGTAAEERV